MILLDTHVVVWLAFEPEKLSKRAKEAIRAARLEGGLAIAAISLLELAWLAEKGRVETTLSVRILRPPLRFQNDSSFPLRRRSQHARSTSPIRIRKILKTG
jgi:PIN domain nuclease of toxin-antitoxin system